jgi:molybdopterin-guanine dinucleotide biosynthesis protein A
MNIHLQLPPVLGAVLLCGGQSRRMGQDKATLRLKGQALWLRQAQILQAMHPLRLGVACREGQQLHRGPEAPEFIEWLFDPETHEGGPLGIILRCLEHFEMPTLVLAVDMPLMNIAVLRWICGGHQPPAIGRIPKIAGHFEPLAALYTPAAAGVLREAIGKGDFKLQHAAEHLLELGLAMAIEPSGDQLAAFENLNDEAQWRGLQA